MFWFAGKSFSASLSELNSTCNFRKIKFTESILFPNPSCTMSKKFLTRLTEIHLIRPLLQLEKKSFLCLIKYEIIPLPGMEKILGRLSIKLQQKCQNCIYMTLRTFWGRRCFCILRVHEKVLSKIVFFWKIFKTLFFFCAVKKFGLAIEIIWAGLSIFVFYLSIGTTSGNVAFSRKRKVYFFISVL